MIRMKTDFVGAKNFSPLFVGTHRVRPNNTPQHFKHKFPPIIRKLINGKFTVIFVKKNNV